FTAQEAEQIAGSLIRYASASRGEITVPEDWDVDGRPSPDPANAFENVRFGLGDVITEQGVQRLVVMHLVRTGGQVTELFSMASDYARVVAAALIEQADLIDGSS